LSKNGVYCSSFKTPLQISTISSNRCTGNISILQNGYNLLITKYSKVWNDSHAK